MLPCPSRWSVIFASRLEEREEDILKLQGRHTTHKPLDHDDHLPRSLIIGGLFGPSLCDAIVLGQTAWRMRGGANIEGGGFGDGAEEIADVEGGDGFVHDY